MTPLRIGIVGAGENTVTRHIPGLREQAGIEIVAVCNRSRESSAKVARRFDIPRIGDHWTELVAAPDIDAIVIGTWPYLHCPVTLTALSAGKHVLCEARMAMDAVEAHRMLDAARTHPRLVAQIVPSPMTLGVDRTIVRLLREGYVGELLAIEIRGGGGFLDRKAPLQWRQDFEKSGYNVLSLGIWYEAMMRWVGEATRVTAEGRTFGATRRDAEGHTRAVRVPDHLDVIADLACGAQAHLQISAVTGLAGPAEAWLFGSDGTLRFADDRLFGGRKGNSRLSEIAIPARERGGWRVEREFVNAIRGLETITHTTFDDGVKYMEFTEAVARAIAFGRAVDLPLQLHQ